MAEPDVEAVFALELAVTDYPKTEHSGTVTVRSPGAQPITLRAVACAKHDVSPLRQSTDRLRLHGVSASAQRALAHRRCRP